MSRAQQFDLSTPVRILKFKKKKTKRKSRSELADSCLQTHLITFSLSSSDLLLKTLDQFISDPKFNHYLG